jgi:hypothetical protein
MAIFQIIGDTDTDGVTSSAMSSLSQESCDTHSPAQGYLGVTGVQIRDRMRTIKRWGISKDVDAKYKRTSISRKLESLELEYTTLSISHPTVSLRDLFDPQI